MRRQRMHFLRQTLQKTLQVTYSSTMEQFNNEAMKG